MRKKHNAAKSQQGKIRTNTNQKGRGRSNMKTTSDTLTKDDVKNSGNDPAWYAADPAILRDAASFPFSWPTGATNVHDLTLYSASNKAPFSKVPGICSLVVNPGLGFAIRATDPINVAAQSIYSFVRHANAGHSNYDAPDLMLYILGMANAYSYLVWCQRLYGYALTYDQRNRYIPNELIRLNNVDPDDIRDNLANFRFWINTLIAKMASFAVPATLSIFSRMTFMYSDYYLEGTSIKEQLYQFVPDGFYKFGLDSDQKGRLEWTAFDRSQLMSVSDVMTYGNTLFGSIWNEEDFGIMSGDILKAYGDRIIKLTSIPEAYSIAPKFDPMVLTQMKNALILDMEGSNINQNSTGLITQTMTPRNYTTSDKFWGTNTNFDATNVTRFNAARLSLLKDYKALTVDTDDPNPDVVMEASRLMYSYDSYLAEVHLGTEFVHRVILTYDVGSDYVFDQLNMLSANVAALISSGMSATQVMKHFHYLPRLYWCVVINGNYDTELIEIFDLDNFAVLSNSDLAKLHQAAVINMYAVPSIGKVQ